MFTDIVDFPVGFKFLPTDKELLDHFLYNKVIGRLEPVDALSVKEVDLYGDKEPWQIWDEHGGPQVEAQGCHDLYFFTRLKAMDRNGSGGKICRTVCRGRGTWSGEDAGKLVYKWDKSSKKRVLLGFKKNFSYAIKGRGGGGGGGGVGKRWIMKEYSLNPELPLPSTSLRPPNNNLVLCLLRKPQRARG